MKYIFLFSSLNYVRPIGNLPDQMCALEKLSCENCFGSVYYGPYFTQMGSKITTIEEMEKEPSYYVKSGVNGEPVTCSHNATLFPSDHWELDPYPKGPKVCLCSEMNINWTHLQKCDGLFITTFEKIISHDLCQEICYDEFVDFKNLYSSKE